MNVNVFACVSRVTLTLLHGTTGRKEGRAFSLQAGDRDGVREARRGLTDGRGRTSPARSVKKPRRGFVRSFVRSFDRPSPKEKAKKEPL